MSHRVLICCCCSAWLFAPLTIASRSLASDEVDRAALTSALAQHRLRELAWVTSRAVYLAHARTLEEAEQPADAGVAWLYVALTELHASDLAAAQRSLVRSRELLGDAAGSQNTVHEEARRLCEFWKSQWDSRSEWLSVANRLASDARPRQREVVIWLQPDKKVDKSRSEQPAAEPLAYRLLDPAVFTEAVQAAVTSLPSGDNESPPVRWTAWRALLRDDRQLAESVFEKLNSTTTDAAEPLEAECLRLACAARVGRSEIVESSWQRLRDAEWLPLWGLRALSLVAGRDPRGLELAQQSVRALIGEQHPFDSLLLFPQERDRWAKSDWLRDYYWEIGGLHGEFGAASHGGWLDFPVAKEFVRSERLLSELKSPLRLGSRSPMTALRSVTTALACARIGDFESWPHDVTADSLPLWSEVSELAREVAGDLRTHSPGRLIDRDEETRVEPLEWLLLGIEVESGSPGAARITAAPPPTSLLGRWPWWPAMLLVVVGLAGLWSRFRAGC